MENKIKFSREEQKDFNFWKRDGNVSKNEDGSYSTQDSQWTNRLKDLDALKQYYYKEFLSNRPRYAGGGRTMKNRAKKQAIKDIKSNLWRPQAPYQSVEKPSEEWERYELPYDTKLQYDFEPDSFSVQGKRYSEYAKGGEIKVNGMSKQDYIDAFENRVGKLQEDLKKEGKYDEYTFDFMMEIVEKNRYGGFTDIEETGFFIATEDIDEYKTLAYYLSKDKNVGYRNYTDKVLSHFYFGKPMKIEFVLKTSGDTELALEDELQKIKLLSNKIDFNKVIGVIDYEKTTDNTDLYFYKDIELVMSLNGDWDETTEELDTIIDVNGETAYLNYHPLDSMGGVNMQQLKKNINEAFKELNTYSAVVSIEGYEEYAEDVEGLENAKSVIQDIKGNTRFQVLKGSSVGIGKRVDSSRVVEEYAKGGEAGFDDTGTSMAMYHEKKGNFMVAKGQVYLWFYDVENSAKKIESGEFDYVLYPFSSLSMMGQRGFIPPLKKIWTKKFQKQTKGSEHLLGVIKAFLIEEDGKKELYIDMMSVNPTKKKKGVMSYMIKDLRDTFNLTQDQVTFSNLTEDGKKFVVKKTYADGGQPVQYVPVQQMPQQPVQYVPVQQMPQQPVQYVPVQQMPQQSPQQPVNSPFGNLDINSAINFVKENPQVLSLLKDGGEASEFKKGGNVSSIEKRVAEVNALIKEGNDKGVQVIDKTTTWEAPMKYNPIKYTNGVLYVSYKQLDLYKYKKGMGSEWKNESYRIGKNEMGENISRGSAQTDTLSYIARMYRSAINDFNKYGYDVGGRVKTKEYFQIFKLENLLDKTELLLTEEELNKFISKWNLDNLTDYADWVEFNEYEDYKRITPVFSKNEYGGNVNNSFVESEINSVSTWENEEIASYLQMPVNEVAKHRDYYVEETQNAMLVNQVDGDYAGGGGVKLKNNNINWVKNVGEEGWSKDMAYKNAYENSGGYISTSGNWQIYRDGRFYYDKDMGGDNYKRDGDWIVRRNDEFYGEFDSLIEAKEFVENWVRINPKDYAGGGEVGNIKIGDEIDARWHNGMRWTSGIFKGETENGFEVYDFSIEKPDHIEYYAEISEDGYGGSKIYTSTKFKDRNYKNYHFSPFKDEYADGGDIEEIKTKYQIAGSDKNGVYTYSKRVADEIAKIYGGYVQEDGSNWYVRLEEKYADGGDVKNKIQLKNFSDLKQGDVIRKKEKLGTTIFVVNKSPVQNRIYKNEYDVLVTCIVSNTNFYKPLEEYYIKSVIKYGKLGNVDYLGKWNYDDKIDYSIYLPKSNKTYADGGEASELNIGQIFEVNRDSEKGKKYFDFHYGKGYVFIISDIFNEKVIDENQFWDAHIKLKVYDSNLKYIFPIRVFFKGKPYGLNLTKKLFSELLSDKSIFPSDNYYVEKESDYDRQEREFKGNGYVELIKRKINPIWKSIIDKFSEIYFSNGTDNDYLVSDQVKARGSNPYSSYEFRNFSPLLSWADAEGKFKQSLTADELNSIEISYNTEEYADLEEHDTEKYHKQIVVKLKTYAGGGDVPHEDKMFQLPLEMVIYVPSTQDVDKVISVDKMDKRVDEVKIYLANKFGGYTSADKLGGFVDSTGNLVNEDVVQVTSFSTKEAYAENKEELINQLAKWGEEWGQESIGFEFEGDLMYVPQKFKQGGGVDTFSDYSNDALSDMIINLSRYENTEKEIQIVKAELEKRKGENKDIEE